MGDHQAKACIKCGAGIEIDAKRGRPARYCSEACRRSAEQEIRRVTKRIADLEAVIDYWAWNDPHLAETKGPRVQAQIERLETRLRMLYERDSE